MTMNKATKARKYNSSKLQLLLDEVTPLEMEKTKNKMLLAARIEDLMTARGWSKSQFAEKVGKNPSEITKWLSGTQNFTVDVLTEIASTLGVELVSLYHKQEAQIISKSKIEVTLKVKTNTIKILTPYTHGVDGYGLSIVACQEAHSTYSPYTA